MQLLHGSPFSPHRHSYPSLILSLTLHRPRKQGLCEQAEMIKTNCTVKEMITTVPERHDALGILEINFEIFAEPFHHYDHMNFNCLNNSFSSFIPNKIKITTLHCCCLLKSSSQLKMNHVTIAF